MNFELKRAAGWATATVVYLSVVALGVSTLVALSAHSVRRLGCELGWRDSGFAWRYEWMAGCRVQAADGRWMPEKSVLYCGALARIDDVAPSSAPSQR